jgi:hypothetical protein
VELRAGVGGRLSEIGLVMCVIGTEEKGTGDGLRTGVFRPLEKRCEDELGIGGGTVSLARASMASIVWRACARPMAVGERWRGWLSVWGKRREGLEGEAGSILMIGAAFVGTGINERPELRLRLRAGTGGLEGVSAKSKAASASVEGDSLRMLERLGGVVRVLDGVRPAVMDGSIEWWVLRVSSPKSFARTNAESISLPVSSRPTGGS